MANLSLKHIYKVYPNGAKAVNDFNMQIEDKEFIVFVGPSGCGKSTTLRMIAGLEDISAGELKIGEQVVNDMEPKDRDIAMVFQNYALYPHMTVYDNIAFGLRLRKLPKEQIHQKVMEAAEILGITDYLGRKPKEMSGGQRQRVSLGRAIVREPKVMLLDEPLSNLDAKLRTQMRTEISKLHAKLNTTFIYVTHDQIEAMTMGTRIVVMRGGYVQQIDTPKNLYRFPQNKFVAGFIGTPQMNFFEATLEKKGEEVRVEFAYSAVTISLPYSYFCKAKPAYFNGTQKVFFGLRAEDISFDGDKLKRAEAKIPVKVSHIEELGDETLVYGDINMEGDGFSESATRVIVKVTDGERAWKSGEVLEAALDVSRMHLFDAQTEESILPRIPEYNSVPCSLKGGEMLAFGEKIALPPALQGVEGEGELRIPCEAFKLGGALTARVVETEQIGEKFLWHLSVGDARLFALFPEPPQKKELSFCVDFKKISVFVGKEEVVKAMPERVSMLGKLEKKKTVKTVEERGKRKRRKTVGFCLNIEESPIFVSDEIAQKLFGALGVKGALSANYRFECSPYHLRVGAEGLRATVEEIVDYGEEKFALCKTASGRVYAHTVSEVSGEIMLVPDVENLEIYDKALQVRVV